VAQLEAEVLTSAAGGVFLGARFSPRFLGDVRTLNCAQSVGFRLPVDHQVWDAARWDHGLPRERRPQLSQCARGPAEACVKILPFPQGSSRSQAPREADFAVQFRTIHGYRRAFVHAGKGPVLLLIHGIGDSSETWRNLIPLLARDHTVIAPDLLGHGSSEKPRADYSVAAYANAMRDLLSVLGVERATVVGHSLGGGVAMQFAYQYPERCERLVLVSSGGVSREVHPMLRLASAPAAELVLPLLRLGSARALGHAAFGALALLQTDIGRDAEDLIRVFDALPDATARRAFVRTLRAVVDVRGQVITMLDRCYLTRGMPTLLVWGDRDAVVPYEHARIAHAAMPGSQLHTFEGAGHFPHHADPTRFLGALYDFLGSTSPASYSAEEWREFLRRGPQQLDDAGLSRRAQETLALEMRSAT
jgi:pimeloyl-ACP methyl ester carboxylesterase